jgi:hypothetical protein
MKKYTNINKSSQFCENVQKFKMFLNLKMLTLLRKDHL